MANTIPDWFWTAVETPATPATVEVDGCDVCYRCWGSRDRPPMLLVHGMYAHSRWWDFIAPQLIDDWFVVAMDLTGMGDSDFRYEYSADGYAEEIRAVCDAAGLGPEVIVVAHSFGGLMAVKAANIYPDRFGALVLVDSGIRAPDDPPPVRPPLGGRPAIYPDRESGENRFRLQPPQPCENQFLLKYIARESLMRVDGGWAWKFDDDLPTTLKGVQREPQDYQNLRLPVAVIYGAQSETFTARMAEYMADLVPGELPTIAVEGAFHHVFLDRPLEFIAALRKVIGQLR